MSTLTLDYIPNTQFKEIVLNVKQVDNRIVTTQGIPDPVIAESLLKWMTDVVLGASLHKTHATLSITDSNITMDLFCLFPIALDKNQIIFEYSNQMTTYKYIGYKNPKDFPMLIGDSLCN